MFICDRWHGQFLTGTKWSITSYLRNDELNVQGHEHCVRPWVWGCTEFSVCIWLRVILKDMAWWAQLFVWQWQRHSSDNCVHAERSFQTGCPRPQREITVGQLPLGTVSCSGCWQLLGGWSGGGGGGPEWTWCREWCKMRCRLRSGVYRRF